MKDGIFRQEAVEHHSRAPLDGDPLVHVPPWTHWTYRLLVVAVTAGAGFVAFAQIPRYVHGPAIIRAQQRVGVTAATSGVIASIDVTRGTRVVAGDVLVRLRSAKEQAELDALEREFATSLVRVLADPADQSARATLGNLKAQREVLHARLEERLIRTTDAGTVGDVRVREGQNVAPGEVIASIVKHGAQFYVTALLPGEARPSLAEGQEIRIELAGFRYSYQTVTVEMVENDIVSASEVRRILGPEVSDGIQAHGPVVIVRAPLTDASFVSDGVTYAYFDGMHATARVRLRAETLLTNLIPAARLLTNSWR